METWDAIRSRRNVRVFSERAIDESDLARVLEAGRRAPSSRNWQPWDFIVVTDRLQLVALAQVWRSAGHVARAAAAVAFVGPVLESDANRDWLWFDHGQAMMSMMIAAADLGIGSGHAAVADQELARTILGRPRGPVLRRAHVARLSGGPRAGAAPAPRSATVRRGRPPRTL